LAIRIGQTVKPRSATITVDTTATSINTGLLTIQNPISTTTPKTGTNFTFSNQTHTTCTLVVHLTFQANRTRWATATTAIYIHFVLVQQIIMATWLGTLGIQTSTGQTINRTGACLIGRTFV
jgi:hypothetical protein